MNKNKLITPEGTRDYIFEEAKVQRSIERQLCDVAQSFKYQEVITPALEFLDVYTTKGHSIPLDLMYKLTDQKGRLMAIRPDSTLPIARLASTRLKGATLPLRLYYNQAVYSKNRSLTGRSDEIKQLGIELIGVSNIEADIEVLMMAVQSLELIDSDFRLEIGHIGIFNPVLAALDIDIEIKDEIRQLIEMKNYPVLNDVIDSIGGCEFLKELPRFFGDISVIEKAKAKVHDSKALEALDYLSIVYNRLSKIVPSDKISLDLGIVNRTEYYTGIVFKGYVGEEVLSGGRYDNLLEQFSHSMGAIGYAINIDAVTRLLLKGEHIQSTKPIRIALTKGRLEKDTIKILEEIGYDCEQVHNKGRRLILPISGNIEIVLAKSADVITYIENGVCDIGVVGKDTIAEYGGSFFELLDLKLGKCRFCLACKDEVDFYSGYKEKTIATKYPNVARTFFETKGMDVRIVKIEGSVELAPLLDLADGIVDIVETGSTLFENGLKIVETISQISARVIVNTASLKLRKDEIEDLIQKLGERVYSND